MVALVEYINILVQATYTFLWSYDKREQSNWVVMTSGVAVGIFYF